MQRKCWKARRRMPRSYNDGGAELAVDAETQMKATEKEAPEIKPVKSHDYGPKSQGWPPWPTRRVTLVRVSLWTFFRGLGRQRMASRRSRFKKDSRSISPFPFLRELRCRFVWRYLPATGCLSVAICDRPGSSDVTSAFCGPLFLEWAVPLRLLHQKLLHQLLSFGKMGVRSVISPLSVAVFQRYMHENRPRLALNPLELCH